MISGLQQKKEEHDNEICICTGCGWETTDANLSLRQGTPDVKIRTGKSSGYLAIHDPAYLSNQNKDPLAGHGLTGSRKNQHRSCSCPGRRN